MNHAASGAASEVVVPDQASKRRTAVGIVARDRCDKTRRVEIRRLTRHPIYGKILRKRTVCYVHDEYNESRVGDLVEIRESRPLSRLKRWVLVKIIKRGKPGGLSGKTQRSAIRKSSSSDALEYRTTGGILSPGSTSSSLTMPEEFMRIIDHFNEWAKSVPTDQQLACIFESEIDATMGRVIMEPEDGRQLVAKIPLAELRSAGIEIGERFFLCRDQETKIKPIEPEQFNQAEFDAAVAEIERKFKGISFLKE